MPDLSRNLVYLRWLLKLVDFRATGELSWGSAVLATLYKEMCGVMRPNKAKIGDRYDYIPTWEPIIVSKLACMPKYMPWFRIYGKPYLLSEEERQRQIRVPRERRGLLNPRRRDDDAGPSTAPT
ncbi:hypothetical protein J1N35_037591 [Gossypium stocksii]|uniref:Aminotransferase-like plant mobile domain-containing protein n=1 Tax=Gossypium stocksii TaxID=47602 RepID=A0A9D3UKD6_9ROSI|nr:hypothetical protein J1N35_037591 [Gossypium stocksii]